MSYRRMRAEAGVSWGQLHVIYTICQAWSWSIMCEKQVQCAFNPRSDLSSSMLKSCKYLKCVHLSDVGESQVSLESFFFYTLNCWKNNYDWRSSWDLNLKSFQLLFSIISLSLFMLLTILNGLTVFPVHSVYCSCYSAFIINLSLCLVLSLSI